MGGVLGEINFKGKVVRTSAPDDLPAPVGVDRPANAAILDYFHKNSMWDPIANECVLRARPDLSGELYDIIAELGIPKDHVQKESAYGWPAVANRAGTIFTWTGGTGDVFLRLSSTSFEDAHRDGARSDPTYPPGWADFYIVRLGQRWREILKKWVKISYEESLNIE